MLKTTTIPCIRSITFLDWTKDLVFFIESWGQLTAKEIFNKAIESFDNKLDTFAKEVKA